MGVLHESEGQKLALAPGAEALRSDGPGSLAGWARYAGRPYYWNSWGNLIHSIRTGETGFSALYGGSVWDYREAHSEENDFFNAAMVSLTNTLIDALLAAYDFSPYGLICDIGGGTGVLLASILRKHTAARGILFDMPHVVAGAAPDHRVGARVLALHTVGGDMFASDPGRCRCIHHQEHPA